MKHLIIFFILLFSFCGNVFSTGNKYVIVIDPGHGGKDSGAIRGKAKEKDINLGVALVLGELIEKNMPDVKVVYTRKDDAFVALDKRADIANKAKANLFISIHTNSTAAKKTTAKGADTYILGLSRSDENLDVAKRENSVILLEDDYTTKYEGFDPNSPESYIIFEFMSNKYRDQSLDFASYIQRDFKKVAKRQDRGVREAGFLVLRRSSMPSVLIELGFINNEEEATFLTSKSGQRIMATSIFSGLKDYIKNLDKIQPTGDNKQTNGSQIASNQSQNSTRQETSGSTKTDTAKDIIQEKETKTETVKIEKEEPSVKPNTIPVKKDNSKQHPFLIEKESSAQVITNATQPKQEVVVPSDKKESTVKITNDSGITYRVQFLYSPKRFKANVEEFKGLAPVEYFYQSGYKYTYGETADKSVAEKILVQVRKKFKDAFIITDDSKTNRKYFSLSNSTESQNTNEKNKVSNIKPTVNINAVSENIGPEQIEYRVQFLFSPTLLPNNSPRFKGLSPVDVYEDKGGFKYTYGSTTNKNDIEKVLTEINKLFNDAFIIEFKNGIRTK